MKLFFYKSIFLLTIVKKPIIHLSLIRKYLTTMGHPEYFASRAHLRSACGFAHSPLPAISIQNLKNTYVNVFLFILCKTDEKASHENQIKHCSVIKNTVKLL